MDQKNNNTQEQRETSKAAAGKLVRIASVMIAIAIVGICFAYTKLEGTGIGQIAMYTISALLALLGAFIIFVMATAHTSTSTETTSFSTTRKQKKTSP